MERESDGLWNKRKKDPGKGFCYHKKEKKEVSYAGKTKTIESRGSFCEDLVQSDIFSVCYEDK